MDISIECGYVFHLIEGPKWRFTATNGVCDWLKKFTSILQIPADGSIPKECREIHFLPNNPGRHLQSIHNHHSRYPGNARDINSYCFQAFPQTKIWTNNTSQSYKCEINVTGDKKSAIECMRYCLYPIHLNAMHGGGLPLHAALLEKNGKGFLISGSGGVGKSTCCRRIPHSWKALCDDEVLVLRGKSGVYHCHPFPTWSVYLEDRAEHTWDIQYSVTLKAIFFLEQSDTDQATPLGRSVAATHIYASSSQICMRYWIHGTPKENRDQRRLVFENACNMAQNIPAYTLRATPNGSFWEEMERVTDEL